jgi:hypothetical protein
MRSRQRSDDGLSLSRDGPFCVHCSQVWYYYFQDPATAKRRAAGFIHTDLLGLLKLAKSEQDKATKVSAEEQ